MNIDWQTIVVLIVVAGAASYLAGRTRLALARRKVACGGCSNCAADEASVQQIVPIGGFEKKSATSDATSLPVRRP